LTSLARDYEGGKHQIPNIKHQINTKRRISNETAAQPGANWCLMFGIYLVFGAWVLVFILPMPIYEFHCDDCRRDSEVLVRSTEWKGTKCPHCGSAKLEKKLSVFASSGGDSGDLPSCSGTPKSCGRCGTGKPHSH
jgi:putative FmdB family regulatory protein